MHTNVLMIVASGMMCVLAALAAVALPTDPLMTELSIFGHVLCRSSESAAKVSIERSDRAKKPWCSWIERIDVIASLKNVFVSTCCLFYFYYYFYTGV